MALAEVWSDEWAGESGSPVELVAVPGLAVDDPLEIAALAAGLLDQLAAADLARLSDDSLAPLAAATTSLVAQATAIAADAAAEVERRGHGRTHGFFSTRTFVGHHCQLSGPTAHARTQTMRMFELLPSWARSARAGLVGADQTVLMARVAANPRISADLAANIDALLDDARSLPYREFERRLRRFERLADPDGAKQANERAVDDRDATMRQRPDGSWRLEARFPSLDGAEVNEVLAHFIEAEFQQDLATTRLGGSSEPGMSELPRLEPQRRADALLAAMRAAAVNPGPERGPLPCLSVLIDERTLGEKVAGDSSDPARYREVVGRTQNGDELDLDDVAGLALWGHVRRAIHDGKGTVTDLGRRRRLFTGSARDAALLLSMTCNWPGCDRPVRNCEVDHAVSWLRHGGTDPDNGCPLCKRHNLLKERGRFGAHRDHEGIWRITDADGHVVG